MKLKGKRKEGKSDEERGTHSELLATPLAEIPMPFLGGIHQSHYHAFVGLTGDDPKVRVPEGAQHFSV